MTEIKNTNVIDFEDISDDEMNAMIDGTLTEFDEGDLVKGTVVKIEHDECLLDIGFKSEGVIPARELSIRKDADPSEIVALGDEIEALVLQKEDKDGRLILSKKRAEYERAWISVEEKFKAGETVTGEVIEVVKGGLILDLGGIDGLVHISELSWNHVNHPSEVVKVGDEVEVEVLDVDLQRERISLGLKQTTEDPWLKLIESYPVGTIVDGKVTKVVPFGAFVELGNNVEGLVHISEMAAKHIDTPAQVVKVGQDVKVKVMDINPDRRRISLSMKAAAHDLGFEVEVDETIQAPEPRQPKKKAAAPKAEKPATEEAAE